MTDPKDPNLEDEDEALRLDDEEESSDAGSVNDEGGGETEAGQESQDAQAQEGLGRREKRIQALRREAQEASDRASRFERELNEERARYRQQPQQGETTEQENARLALMTAEER